MVNQILECYEAFTEQDEQSLEEMIDAYKPRGKILIAAPYRNCFKNWASKVGISPSHRVLRYIHGMHSAQGYDPNNIVVVSLCSWKVKSSASLDALVYLKRLNVTILSDECIEGGRQLEQQKRQRT